MHWETFYLVCFVLGLALSAISLLGGMGHLGVGHVHLPHAGHVPHLLHGAARPPAPGSMARGGGNVPWWNAFSLMIFLCWFGAAGYLLSRHGSFVALLVLMLAALSGLAGGTIVFLFLTKVLLPHERELTADETDVVGAVGRVSSPLRKGGTGEIVYEQLGARRSVPARSEDGGAIQKQEEVYVTRYEKGIAYVRRWEEALVREPGSAIREQGPAFSEPRQSASDTDADS
jgi:membrane protein implicated in regulation of membrane protease activity